MKHTSLKTILFYTCFVFSYNKIAAQFYAPINSSTSLNNNAGFGAGGGGGGGAKQI